MKSVSVGIANFLFGLVLTTCLVVGVVTLLSLLGLGVTTCSTAVMVASLNQPSEVHIREVLRAAVVLSLVASVLTVLTLVTAVVVVL
jgi:hypothetical protein